MSQPPLVAIITLNWNLPEATIACLESARQQTHPRCVLIAVDNGSSDDSVQRISAAMPAAILLAHPRNSGFATGMNIGLRHALAHGADYCLIVNNDAILAPDLVAALLAHAAADVGLLAPAIFYASQPTRIWSVGGRCHPLTLEKTGDGPPGWPAGAGPVDRDYVVGCGMLLTRALLEQIGLFDERFFMYYEDMDLCRRLRQAGSRIRVVPAAKMWHQIAASSGGHDSPAERYWMARSSVLFFHKHVAGPRWLIVAPYRVASALRTLIRLCGRGRFPAANAYLRGLRDGLAELRCAS